MERVHAVVARSTFPSLKTYKTHHSRTTFGSSDVEKVYAHISKSNCTKPYMFAPLLEVRMLKKCTPLWREAHFEVKMYKNLLCSRQFWRFGCRKSARRCGVKMYKTPGVRTTFGGSDVASLQDTTLQDITLHYTPVHYITLHYTTLHSSTLHYTKLHYTTLH